MNSNKQKQAVIYCRLASGTDASLPRAFIEQELFCQAFARVRDYEVLEVFRDHEPGLSVDRPGLKAMIAFLQRDPEGQVAIIVQDIARLARDFASLADLHSKLGQCREIVQAMDSDGSAPDMEPMVELVRKSFSSPTGHLS